MSAIGRFLAYRLARMMVALWSVVTVVFIVMRLSGDPVPLLLPLDAPIAEMERARGGDEASAYCRGAGGPPGQGWQATRGPPSPRN